VWTLVNGVDYVILRYVNSAVHVVFRNMAAVAQFCDGATNEETVFAWECCLQTCEGLFIPNDLYRNKLITVIIVCPVQYIAWDRI